MIEAGCQVTILAASVFEYMARLRVDAGWFRLTLPRVGERGDRTDYCVFGTKL